MNQSEKWQYWAGIIEKQTISGLSIPAFCKANELSSPTFHYWLKKLTEQNDESQHAHTIVINNDIGTDTVALHFPNGIKAELPATQGESMNAQFLLTSLKPASCTLSK